MILYPWDKDLGHNVLYLSLSGEHLLALTDFKELLYLWPELKMSGLVKAQMVNIPVMYRMDNAQDK